MDGTGASNQAVLTAARVPVATYRLQFNPTFTFRQAFAATEYLHELGISDCYASPLFQATPQSTHGYDICAFDCLNRLLGTPADFEQWVEVLQRHGMGLLLDMVPNHMAADLSNPWWFDVLANGPGSRYASWFDITWHPTGSNLQDKVLLPILEDDYRKVLEAGKLQIVFENGNFSLNYANRNFPLAPQSYRNLEPQHLASQERSPGTRSQINSALQRLNGGLGLPSSFDALDSVLQQQHYRLVYWRLGSTESNYRRFFDVTELVCLRMELPEVFEATHAFLLELIRSGKVTGLRIDHPDGLWEPRQYFERLQSAAPSPLYIVAEKILTKTEALPSDWPISGTTGYDFLNVLNGLFVDSSHEAVFDSFYREFAGCETDFSTVLYLSKKKVQSTLFASELSALARNLEQLSHSIRGGRDFSLSQLHAALDELVALFPVYRTYIDSSGTQTTAQERAYVLGAVRLARAQAPGVEPDIFDFLQDILLLDFPERMNPEERQQARDFTMKFQQLTGPAMAKGLEDTAFYNFNRLLSLNEVGGNPDAFGTDLTTFHAHNISQARHWPHTLLATATHDTKRGEDVRARLNVLSEMQQEWRAAVQRWSRFNAGKKSLVKGQPAPSQNDEYFLYQTLVGAWPHERPDAAFRERLIATMLKSIREAKAHTSWLSPESTYEQATCLFIERLLSGDCCDSFLEDFLKFQRRAAFFGRFNSLAQVLLKIMSPGVPDFYQGTELWDFSLVDPDNRRPVDYELRHKMLTNLEERLMQSDPGWPGFLKKLLLEAETGEVKMYLTWRLLQFRKRHAGVFSGGDYRALEPGGRLKQHVCAFARTFQDQLVVAIAPRLVLGLTGGIERAPIGGEVWLDTFLELPQAKAGDRYQNVLTNQFFTVAQNAKHLPLSDALGSFPVALLVKIPVK
jgi:(1->4)-alpha-D-glucan 1-alpha-D-glucosylmutase